MRRSLDINVCFLTLDAARSLRISGRDGTKGDHTPLLVTEPTAVVREGSRRLVVVASASVIFVVFLDAAANAAVVGAVLAFVAVPLMSSLVA